MVNSIRMNTKSPGMGNIKGPHDLKVIRKWSNEARSHLAKQGCYHVVPTWGLLGDFCFFFYLCVQ